ncbi:MAG: alpha-amylase [Lachnospiraceae bacterium]|nr:alpha-amylase [Lachnospiraceae bacterium]
MAWYDEAIFYHIYPLGLLGCPRENDHGDPVHRLTDLAPWVRHISRSGFNAIYIGPLFESVGHGYETTDYRQLDRRLGTNEDLKAFVADCHKNNIKVIFDGVFNHTGRDFFAYRDIKENRENSRYLGWYSGLNLGGNNSFNDGFSYDNWGGFDLLARLNQKNPEVQGYIADVIRFWVDEFDVDGIRLDAADVLDFDFMRMLRRVADEVKPDFYLMGEVIHGEYIRWERDAGIHAVTNYHLHKALFSGHNDHNYFEIAHTVKRLYDMAGGDPMGLRLYNFADNHDVERIYSRLNNKAHFMPLHVLLYTLPGIPSVYYGSEFAIEGKKGGGDDWGLRPALDLDALRKDDSRKPYCELIKALGEIRKAVPALSYGVYEQLLLTNRQYGFARKTDNSVAAVAVNNDDNPAWMDLHVPAGRYRAMLSGAEIDAAGGNIHCEIGPAGGEIYVKIEGEKDGLPGTEPVSSIPAGSLKEQGTKAEEAADRGALPETSKEPGAKPEAVQAKAEESSDSKKELTGPASVNENAIRTGKPDKVSESKADGEPVVIPDKPYEEMTVPELQAAILQKMAGNGVVTDEMKRSVSENVWHDSLVNWVKSFR